MVIRGGTKDYYDGLQSLDRDKEVIYDRRYHSFKIHDQELPSELREFFSENRYMVHLYHKAWARRETEPCALGALIFCGVPHLLVYRRYSDWSRPCLLEQLEFRLEYEWTSEQPEHKILGKDREGRDREWGRQDTIAEKLAESRYRYFMDGDSGLNKVEADALVHEFKDRFKDLDMTGLCLKYDAPILSFPMGGPGPIREVHANIRLKDLEFQKVLGAHQCYQELMMFVGGKMARLVPDPAPTTVGSDEVICAQKGFDPKISFRQAPGRKDETRRKNRLRKRGLLN